MLKLKKIRPLNDTIITTAKKYAVDDYDASQIITDVSKMAGALMEYQKVVAVGPFIKDIKVGDIVCINPKNYTVHKFEENSMKNDLMQNNVVRYNFNIVELNDLPHLMLTSRDIDFIIEDYEETASNLVDINPTLHI